MENKINIGIVGNGFVGSAIAHGFSLWAKLRIYDKNQKLSTHSLKDVVQKSEIVFVCVPTPMDTSDANKIDLSILDSVMADIHNYNDNYDGKNTVIVIKSTVIPGTTKKYEKMYPTMKIVFNPEFLSERTAKLDFSNPLSLIHI